MNWKIGQIKVPAKRKRLDKVWSFQNNLLPPLNKCLSLGKTLYEWHLLFRDGGVRFETDGIIHMTINVRWFLFFLQKSNFVVFERNSQIMYMPSVKLPINICVLIFILTPPMTYLRGIGCQVYFRRFSIILKWVLQLWTEGTIASGSDDPLVLRQSLNVQSIRQRYRKTP